MGGEGGMQEEMRRKGKEVCMCVNIIMLLTYCYTQSYHELVHSIIRLGDILIILIHTIFD